MEQVKMTEDEYLSSKGVGFCVSDYNLDKTRLPHGETLRQQRKGMNKKILLLLNIIINVMRQEKSISNLLKKEKLFLRQ